MKKYSLFVLLTLMTVLISCVSKKKFAELTDKQEICGEELAAARMAYGQMTVKADGLKDQLSDAQKQNLALQEALTSCLQNSNTGSANISKLLDEIDESNAYIKTLVDSKFKNDSLNLYISNQLKRSLNNLSDDEVDVKVLKGVVFISVSDKMLFKSGSYELSSKAQNVLSKVALVVNDYKDYDVLVEGHTDNDSYNGSGVIKDNWDLSALRATSVVRALQKDYNVDPSRMTAGGRSEYVPKASNETEAGKSENRRTLIVVLPKLDQFLDLMKQAPIIEK